MKHSRETMLERYNTLPPRLQEAMDSPATIQTLHSIGEEHKLDPKQQELLSQETAFMILGLENEGQVEQELVFSLDVPPSGARSIVQKLKEEVLSQGNSYGNGGSELGRETEDVRSTDSQGLQREPQERNRVYRHESTSPSEESRGPFTREHIAPLDKPDHAWRYAPPAPPRAPERALGMPPVPPMPQRSTGFERAPSPPPPQRPAEHDWRDEPKDAWSPPAPPANESARTALYKLKRTAEQHPYVSPPDPSFTPPPVTPTTPEPWQRKEGRDFETARPDMEVQQRRGLTPPPANLPTGSGIGGNDEPLVIINSGEDRPAPSIAPQSAYREVPRPAPRAVPPPPPPRPSVPPPIPPKPTEGTGPSIHEEKLSRMVRAPQDDAEMPEEPLYRHDPYRADIDPEDREMPRELG